MIDFDEMRSMEQVEAAIEVAIKYQFETLSLSFSFQFDFSIPDSIGDITSLKKLEIWSRCCNAHCLQEISPSIGKLANLTSLRISDAYFGLERLPESIGNLKNLEYLCIDSCSKLKGLPMSIGNLEKLQHLELMECMFPREHPSFGELPDTIGQLSSLRKLIIDSTAIQSLPYKLGDLSNLEYLTISNNSKLHHLPDTIGNLHQLTSLNLEGNQLNSLPESIGKLKKLTFLNLEGNPLTDLSALQGLSTDPEILCFGVYLPRRYWTKFSEWEPKWLLEEDNAEIRKVLIENVGYARICEELSAVELDSWREYTLLRIEGEVDIEPILLLKMICPSTGHIHILRVPPDIDRAESAITWIDWGIHPSEIAIAT